MSLFNNNWPLSRPEALVAHSSHATIEDYDTKPNLNGHSNDQYSRQTSTASLSNYLFDLTPTNIPKPATPHHDQQMFDHIVAELQSAASQERITDTVTQGISNLEYRHSDRANQLSSLQFTSQYSPKRSFQSSERRIPFQPSRVTKRSQSPVVQQLANTFTERRQYTTFYSPGEDGEPNSGTIAIFENVGRRRPNELSRPYVCPEESCTLRYQWWRSLQHHISAKHNLSRKKADYPQFANLAT